MIKSSLCHSFASRSKEFFPTGTSIQPLLGKEIITISFEVIIFFGYKGLKWIRYFHGQHKSRVPNFGGEVKEDHITPNRITNLISQICLICLISRHKVCQIGRFGNMEPGRWFDTLRFYGF